MPNKVKTSKRLMSTIFDFIVCVAVSLIIMLASILSLVNALVDVDYANVVALFISTLISGGLVFLFVIVYLIAIPTLWRGQTLGKRFFGIKLVKKDGSDVDIKTLFAREITRIGLLIISLGTSAVANFLSLTISKSHLAFHDVIASTCVIEISDNAEEGVDYVNTH